jgi:hypothetical protein
MDPDLDPADHMPSRAALAREVLLFRMRMLSKLFYEHEWVEDLEFEIWDMAHGVPARFGDKDVSREMAKSFRDLIKLGGGFWAWPEVVGREGDHEVFVPLAEWKKVLVRRAENLRSQTSNP